MPLPEFIAHLLGLQEFLGGPLSAKEVVGPNGKRYLAFYVGDREVQSVTLGS
jgi:hypothetical protein